MTDIESAKQQICEIGKRIYAKNFAAANEGNISIRIGENEVLCTPTLHCKGFMDPEDICTVDMAGNQTAGKRKRTSEVFLHLEIYRQRPKIKSVVHCHPPHATAFGVARQPIPTAVLPEPDIFLGEVPIADYETPGSQDFAETILPFVKKSNIIILANHGTVSYDTEIEKAYWLTEILDAYCKILILSKQLGHTEILSKQKGLELLQLRHDWGFEDSRWLQHESIDIRDFVAFKSTWESAGLKNRSFGSAEGSDKNVADDGLESLVERIADRVVEKLQSQSND